MSAENHEAFMRRAIEAARRGWGDTHPNPMVGALVVEGGRVVADGYHARAGEAHAEVAALRNLGRAPAKGATLYVTLEPCSTTGRTPPCTEAIIKSGIKRVVVGATDPNPRHAGGGLKILRKAGIEVIEGVLADECDDLNLIFNFWITRKRPMIAAKIATTLDGDVATRTGESKWITGTAARHDVMRWRRLFPAIGVGAGAVLADDPQLTSRMGKTAWCPKRLIFNRTLRTVTRKLPRVYSDANRANTIVVTSPKSDAKARARLEKQGVTVWTLPGLGGPAWFPALREQCVASGIYGLFMEGGPTLVSVFLRAGELDYLFAYRSPKFFADGLAIPALSGESRPRLADAYSLTHVRHAILDDNQLMRGYVQYPK